MHKAFTLIEAVLVLTIVSGLMLFGYYQIDYGEQRAESRFWQELDLTWREYQMTTWDKEGGFDFRFYQHALLIWENGRVLKKLTYPRSLRCDVKKTKSVFLSKQGVVKPVKVVFFSKKGQKYEITWGFNWGTYKVTPEPSGIYHR